MIISDNSNIQRNNIEMQSDMKFETIKARWEAIPSQKRVLWLLCSFLAILGFAIQARPNTTMIQYLVNVLHTPADAIGFFAFLLAFGLILTYEILPNMIGVLIALLPVFIFSFYLAWKMADDPSQSLIIVLLLIYVPLSAVAWLIWAGENDVQKRVIYELKQKQPPSE